MNFARRIAAAGVLAVGIGANTAAMAAAFETSDVVLDPVQTATCTAVEPTLGDACELLPPAPVDTPPVPDTPVSGVLQEPAADALPEEPLDAVAEPLQPLAGAVEPLSAAAAEPISELSSAVLGVAPAPESTTASGIVAEAPPEPAGHAALETTRPSAARAQFGSGAAVRDEPDGRSNARLAGERSGERGALRAHLLEAEARSIPASSSQSGGKAQGTAAPNFSIADSPAAGRGPDRVPAPLALLVLTPALASAAGVAVDLARVINGWASTVLFNVWLRRQLRERRMSQRQLAIYSGVDHSTISRLLRGVRAPSLETATKLADALRKIGGLEHAADYFSRLPETEAFPTQRVEAALLGDDELEEEDVRELMNAYLATRARRRRQRLAENTRGTG